jgi:hypothetical protein
MADEQNTTVEAEVPADAMLDVDATADRLNEIASQSIDTNEVARQIEELTSVVLDSAEVSTRSASIAADVSATMRAVVSKIQENNRRNVMHSRVMLGAFCTCLLIAMAIFFAITLKMTKSIKELDIMVYAMAKRVIEVDASLTAIGKTNSDFSEITDKQDEVITTQSQVAKRLEEIGKSMATMPAVVALEANKSSDVKFKDMQKQLTGLETKLQSFDNKLQFVAEKNSARAPAPSAAAQGPSTQVLLAEIQKVKSDLMAAQQLRDRNQASSDNASIKSIEKSMDKATQAAGDAQRAADKAAQSAKDAAAERLAQQKAAAERAVVMRMQPEKVEKSADQVAAERAAAEKAAAARAAKAAAEKAAAEKAAAAERAAEKARAAAAAAAAAAPPPVVREKPIQFPRVPD